MGSQGPQTLRLERAGHMGGAKLEKTPEYRLIVNARLTNLDVDL